MPREKQYDDFVKVHRKLRDHPLYTQMVWTSVGLVTVSDSGMTRLKTQISQIMTNIEVYHELLGRAQAKGEAEILDALVSYARMQVLALEEQHSQMVTYREQTPVMWSEE